MTTLHLDRVTTESALHALRPDWHALWRRAPAATPFQSPAWLLPWWRQFGTHRPVVVTLREGGRLTGLLPAYVLDEGGTQKLLPIGAGTSDSLDALLAADAPPDAAAHLLKCVLDAAPDAVTCDLIDLPPKSPLRHAALPDGWHGELHPSSTCPVLSLAPGTDLRRAIPPATHRKLRMNRHRADRAGGFSVQMATPETLPAMLHALFALHAARWDSQGLPGGVLADARVGAFLADAACDLLQDGVLRLATLRIGAEVAAACLALAAGPDRLMFYMSGFSARHASRSPGSLLLGAMAEAAMAEGRTELHFLRGDEAYKYAWGAQDRHNATRHIVRT